MRIEHAPVGQAENQLDSTVFSKVRAVGRRLPVLKRIALPVWRPFTHLCWLIRNLLTHRRPIRVVTGDLTVLLHPAGQIAEILWVSDFEAGERELIARLTRPGMRVLNIGANVGLYTVITSRLIGPTGEVHAFEPSTTTFARLESNLRLNGLSNVSANNIALSDQTGQLILRSDPRDQSLDGHRFVESVNKSGASPGDEVISCDTLDNYFSRLKAAGSFRPVDFIIMDVEGAEWSVLKGGLSTLRASPDVLLVLECSKNRHAVQQLLAAEGFLFYSIDPSSSRLARADFVAAASVGNVLACRSGAQRHLA
jgi:FkbM family methyltransferase